MPNVRRFLRREAPNNTDANSTQCCGTLLHCSKFGTLLIALGEARQFCPRAPMSAFGQCCHERGHRVCRRGANGRQSATQQTSPYAPESTVSKRRRCVRFRYQNSVAYLRAIALSWSLVRWTGGTPGRVATSRKKASSPGGATTQRSRSSRSGFSKPCQAFFGIKIELPWTIGCGASLRMKVPVPPMT